MSALGTTLARFWTIIAAVAGTVAALITVVAYYETKTVPELSRLEESGGFASALVQEDAMHFGNNLGWIQPLDNPAPFVEGSRNISFNCPDVDPNQMAILTFEVYDITSPRHMELNGKVLPRQPEIVNADHGTWDTIVIIINRDILVSADNVLRVQSLDSSGGTSGNLDDFLIRNIAVLYKQRI